MVDGVGAFFTARFDSECNQCCGEIFEGDDAGYVDDAVVCGECYDEAKAEAE